MARRGRKRKEGPRYPCGQPVRKSQAEQEREAKAVVIDQRVRLHGLDKFLAEQPEAATVFGRMFLQRELAPDPEQNRLMHEAGRYYLRIRSGYLAALCSPRGVQSGSDIDRGPKGYDGSDGTEEPYVERCRRARRAWADLCVTVWEHSGDDRALGALEAFIWDDRRVNYLEGSLRCGLNAVGRIVQQWKRGVAA